MVRVGGGRDLLFSAGGESLGVVVGMNAACSFNLDLDFLTPILTSIDTHPLTGRFVSSLVDWNFLIIALMVEMGISML